MKLSAVIFLFVLLVILLNRCTNPGNEKDTSLEPDSINPNGSSELSVLMRKMHDEAAELKKQLSEGKQPGAFPEDFHRINTASPTDSSTKKPSFASFSSSYLYSLKTLYETDTSEVSIKYNNMVNACLACHSDHCPGPVPKIKKLMMN